MNNKKEENRKIYILTRTKVVNKLRENFKKIDEKFDEKIAYFRNSRDLGFALYLLKAGNKKYAMKIINRLQKIFTSNKHEI